MEPSAKTKKNLFLPILLIGLTIASLTISGFILVKSLSNPSPTPNDPDPIPDTTSQSGNAAQIEKCQAQTSCDDANGDVGCANPASVFCTCMGGTITMKENEQGQYGVCTIQGEEREEWDYYRSTVNPSPPYSCPATEWVDCMPGPDQPVKPECSTEFLNWAKTNCPNFKGAAL